uniref:Putative endoplasmic reticulum membrane protein C16E8.02 n=1 Tax=Anthurium amnicola TaxID=1678845 RepID=A0A1D1YEJ7_9ARAE
MGCSMDLEKCFAFYGAYHSHPVNILIHALCVWPIFFTALLLFYFTPPFFHLPAPLGLPLVFNFGFGFALLYALIYVSLDPRAGSVAALLCTLCWVGSSVLGSVLGFSLAWKETFDKVLEIPVLILESTQWQSLPHVPEVTQVVLAAQLLCWTGQFVGHGIFEGRAPALLNDSSQAILMAPFFVLLEVLQKMFGYEPYPGFRANVHAKIQAERKAWRISKQKSS